jgi:hypothetical protein
MKTRPGRGGETGLSAPGSLDQTQPNTTSHAKRPEGISLCSLVVLLVGACVQAVAIAPALRNIDRLAEIVFVLGFLYATHWGIAIAARKLSNPRRRPISRTLVAAMLMTGALGRLPASSSGRTTSWTSASASRPAFWGIGW